MIRRGQFVTVAVSGDFGKPRPALVVQSDLFADLPSIVICPLTTTLRDDTELIRIGVEPSAANGLHRVSQIAIDKITTVLASKVGEVIGLADAELVLQVDRSLAVLLGLA